jgi:hypothetical protein
LFDKFQEHNSFEIPEFIPQIEEFGYRQEIKDQTDEMREDHLVRRLTYDNQNRTLVIMFFKREPINQDIGTKMETPHLHRIF